jgi:hypothetical protein
MSKAYFVQVVAILHHTGRSQTVLKAARGGNWLAPLKSQHSNAVYFAPAPRVSLRHLPHSARMFATAVLPERLSCSVSKETL